MRGVKAPNMRYCFGITSKNKELRVKIEGPIT